MPACCHACASGRRCASLGDSASNPEVDALRAQVRRFSPEVAATGPFDATLAIIAANIYAQRAQVAAEQGMLVRAAKALAAPASFVAANLGEVTTTIRQFGDARGLPGGGGLLEGSVLGLPKALVLAAAALGVYLAMREW
jgi:hypothetical protein